MTKPSDDSGNMPADPRKARLAQALRDNLRRRKAQARHRRSESREADSGKAAEKGAGGPGRGDS